MRTSIRTTDSAPLLMSFSTPKKYKAEDDIVQVMYDDEKQIVFYLGGGNGHTSPPPRERTHKKRYNSYKAGPVNWDDPVYVSD